MRLPDRILPYERHIYDFLGFIHEGWHIAQVIASIRANLGAGLAESGAARDVQSHPLAPGALVVKVRIVDITQ